MFSIYKDHTEDIYMYYVFVFAILNWYQNATIALSEHLMARTSMRDLLKFTAYSGLFRNKGLRGEALDPRFASSAVLSLVLSVSQKV